MNTAYCILFYLILINIITFIAFGLDKQRARRNKWRISEAALLMLAVLGGSLGAEIGMYGFHHKTRHPRFFLGVPAILLLQICLIFFIRLYFP